MVYTQDTSNAYIVSDKRAEMLLGSDAMLSNPEPIFYKIPLCKEYLKFYNNYRYFFKFNVKYL